MPRAKISSKAPRSKGQESAAATPVVVQGDCLLQLPKLPGAKGGFDLIYVDPPFNAGGVRKARLKTGSRIEGLSAYRDHWGGLDAFLAMLEPRLEAMRRALSSQGSLWLHLDQRTVHDVKVLCDRLFGRAAFQGEIIWLPGNGNKRRSGPGMTHQTILVYSRGAEMIWNEKDEMLRESYADTSLRMHFGHTDSDGRRYRVRTVSGKTYRYYADIGRRLGSVWTDCPAMSANTPLTRETTGYPTQKPLKLLERIVRAASLPHSAVLDPMCGSGTTLVAAARHGRIPYGIDLSAVACGIARKRLADL